MPPRPLADRLLSRLVEDEHGCLIWQGYRNPEGYGVIVERGRLRLVHAVAWELEHGRIRRGRVVLACEHNRACCNPAHLRAATPRQRNRERHPRIAAQIAKTRCPKGHPLSGQNVYRWRGQRHCRQCHRDRQRARYQAGKERGP